MLATASSPLPTAECLSDLEALVALRPEWDNLLANSAANGPFLTWEWLYAWSKHLRGTASLRTITVSSGGELIGVAPFVTTRGAFGWLPRLEFLGTGYAGSDYLDVIVRRGREADVLKTLAGVLIANGVTVRLEHVAEGSFSAQLVERLAGEGWSASTTANGICPVISLAGHTWDSYLATLGASHRANVRRRIRNLEQQYQVQFGQVTTQAERHEALAVLCRFTERRFESDGGSTAFLTPAVQAFQDEATRLMLDRGWLRMYVLRLNGEIAAVMYGFHYNGTFYFYQHGYDDQYQKQSVGLVLMALTVRAAIDEGAQTFDMLWGAEAYKRLWASDTKTLRRFELFPADLGGRIRRHAVQARRHLAPIARRVLTFGESRAV